MDQGPLGSQLRGARPPLLFADCGWQETTRAPAAGMEVLFPSARPFSRCDPCLIGKHLCLNGWKRLDSLRPRRKRSYPNWPAIWKIATKNVERMESASLKPSSVVLNRWPAGQICREKFEVRNARRK